MSKRPVASTETSAVPPAAASPTAGGTQTVQKKKKRFELIRTFSVSDFITLGNGACGTGSIFLCLNYLENQRYQPYLIWAFLLFPLALIFDILDGSVARWRKRSSPYGLDLDSLADVVSFSVAPAVLGFALGLRGIWDSVFLSYFVCCGISRLARYNVTASQLTTESGKVKYYQGVPVPGSLLLVLMWVIAYSQGAVIEHVWWGKFILPGGGTFHPLSVTYFCLGSLMISSRLHIPKP